MVTLIKGENYITFAFFFRPAGFADGARHRRCLGPRHAHLLGSPTTYELKPMIFFSCYFNRAGHLMDLAIVRIG